ncbi:MAG: ATP-binding protein [bacterium]|nr:ATP-binding protein [bacterium]
MTDSELKQILAGWNFWGKRLDLGIPRSFYFDRFNRLFPSGQVTVVTGARRAGKSFLLKQFANELILKGYKENELVLVNFEDPGFVSDLNINLLDSILEFTVNELKPDKLPVLFLDEIQGIPYWEKWVRTIHEQNRAKIVISGSNSKLLGGELATVLTGRHLDIEVFPLTYSEYLTFDPKGSVKDYLTFGGYPRVVLDKEKQELLFSYFNDIFDKDVIGRYKIRKEERIRSLGKFFLANVGSLISYRSLEKFLEISQETAEKFTGYLGDSYLTFLVNKFSFKAKEQERSPRKVYALDGGLANAVGFHFSENYGHLAENAVAVGLRRQKSHDPDFNFYYWSDDRALEVDFLTMKKDKIDKAIQVCWDFSTQKTREREIKAIVKAAKSFDLSKGYIYTWEQEEKIEIDGIGIDVVSLKNCPYL